MTLDEEIGKLITKYGINQIVAALARWCNNHGHNPIFRRLNKIYEWLEDKEHKSAMKHADDWRNRAGKTTSKD